MREEVSIAPPSAGVSIGIEVARVQPDVATRPAGEQYAANRLNR